MFIVNYLSYQNPAERSRILLLNLGSRDAALLDSVAAREYTDTDKLSTHESKTTGDRRSPKDIPRPNSFPSHFVSGGNS
jgi:hypothetical protein